MELTQSVKLFGTDEPPAPARTLRAGALEAVLEAGNLRYIRIGGVEALRGIAFLARDRNWGTYGATIDDLKVDEQADGFRVTYRATCADDAQRLVYHATIEGKANGSLTFAAEGVAESDFVTNRTGFVVLHPLAGVVDHPVTVEHTDGTIEESRFPLQIDPACPFQDIRALTHEIMPGVTVTCRMEGDAFEMEDHRNWMDASFKTYVRPLALPWPYTIPAGETLTQRVTLSVNGTVASGDTVGGGAITVTVGERSGGIVPRVGLAVPAEHAAAALQKAEYIRAARPGFLVCHFDARAGHNASTIAAYRALGEAVGAPLVLEAVLPSVDADVAPTADPDVLKRDMATIAEAAAGTEFERVAFSPASDLKCTLPGSVFPPAPPWEAIAEAARVAFPGLPVGGGMFSYFTELNRKRPPVGVFDFICHSGAPIVHAGDDVSVTETLEALPSIFASVAAFGGGAPYWVLPTTVSMRMNPYGAVPAENPNNIRQAMNRIDPRDRGLLGAAWYAGYLARAARSDMEAVTLAAVAGPSGIVSTPGELTRPWFDDVDVPLMPSWHAIARGSALAGLPAREVESEAPREVQALAADSPDGTALLLVNLTHESVDVRIDGISAAEAEVLDAESFEAACRNPQGMRRKAIKDGVLTLNPYAIAALGAWPG